MSYVFVDNVGSQSGVDGGVDVSLRWDATTIKGNVGQTVIDFTNVNKPLNPAVCYILKNQDGLLDYYWDSYVGVISCQDNNGLVRINCGNPFPFNTNYAGGFVVVGGGVFAVKELKLLSVDTATKSIVVDLPWSVEYATSPPEIVVVSPWVTDSAGAWYAKNIDYAMAIIAHDGGETPMEFVDNRQVGGGALDSIVYTIIGIVGYDTKKKVIEIEDVVNQATSDIVVLQGDTQAISADVDVLKSYRQLSKPPYNPYLGYPTLTNNGVFRWVKLSEYEVAGDYFAVNEDFVIRSRNIYGNYVFKTIVGLDNSVTGVIRKLGAHHVNSRFGMFYQSLFEADGVTPFKRISIWYMGIPWETTTPLITLDELYISTTGARYDRVISTHKTDNHVVIYGTNDTLTSQSPVNFGLTELIVS